MREASWGMKCKVFMVRNNENSIECLCFISLLNHAYFIDSTLVVTHYFTSYPVHKSNVHPHVEYLS